MKVLMIPSWYPTPGAPLLGTFYKEQAEAMAARGVDVAVAHVNVSGDFHPCHNGIRRDVVNGVLTYTYTRPNLTPRWEAGRCGQRTVMLEILYRRIEKEWGRPDVVNLRSSLQGYEAVALCKKHGLPLFFMEHSSYVMTETSDLMRRRLKTVMDAAAVNACVSNALRNAMGYEDIRVIPDPVDGGFFVPKETPARDAFVFHAMGQLRRIKGYDMLICSFARFKEMVAPDKQSDGRPVRLEIAGEGVLYTELQSLIDSLGLGNCCSLVGTIPRDKAPDFMNGCDCFVCSSRVETLSCVLNEAAACGKPVISTQCGGPLDIVTEETGMLVPVDDVEAMAKAMHVVLDLADKYDSVRIRELTLERFGRDAVCEKLIQACTDAMQSGISE